MYYLCFDCARKLGGKWPEGHVATCHGGLCPECGLEKSLASYDDWGWPKNSKKPKIVKSGAGRD